MKKIGFILIVIIILLAGFLFLSDFSDYSREKLVQNKNGNFTLYVSNQSFTIPLVDIKIYIDGKIAVRRYFFVGLQHSFEKFQFALPKGQHQILVKSLLGGTRLEKGFFIQEKHWASVFYWYYPGDESHSKSFSFEFQDHSMNFQ